MVRRGNDALADFVAQAPDRLIGLGTTTVGLGAAVAQEATRVLETLGMPGVAIGTRGGGRQLDDPVNDGLWALLSERQALAFVHPSGVRPAADHGSTTCPSCSATRWRRRLP